VTSAPGRPNVAANRTTAGPYRAREGTADAGGHCKSEIEIEIEIKLKLELKLATGGTIRDFGEGTEATRTI
jgi:hypothetical protein